MQEDTSPSPAPKNSNETRAGYAIIKRRLMFTEIAIGLLAPIVFIAVDGSNGLRDFALEITSNDPLAILIYSMILIAGFTFLTMPLDFYSGYIVEHRFGLSRASARSWLSDFGKLLAFQLLFGLAAIEAIYALIDLTDTYWWLIAAGGFIGFFVVMAQLAPVLILPLFFKFEPVGEGELRDRLLQLADRFNTRVRGVYIWKLGEKTSKSNAALMGFGPTRRVVVADTMIETNSADEIEVVLAHELGHHVNRDIPRLIVMQAFVMLAGFALIHVALSELSGSFGLNGLEDLRTCRCSYSSLLPGRCSCCQRSTVTAVVANTPQTFSHSKLLNGRKISSPLCAPWASKTFLRRTQIQSSRLFSTRIRPSESGSDSPSGGGRTDRRQTT
jgi:STE24 endopeptidase